MKTRSFCNSVLNHPGMLRIGTRLLIVLLSLTVLSGTFLATEIKTSQRAYGPNADILVIYTNGPGNSQDWIGLYREGAPDGGYITWQYLNGNKNGTLAFTAPEEAGNYNFRMFADNGWTLLATSASITVSYPASVDPTFGADGWVKLDFLGTGKSDWISAISVLKNGKILAAGTAKTGLYAPNGYERNEIALARFTSDGKLDGTFGEGGKVHTDIYSRYPFLSLNYQSAAAMVVQQDGKIIVGGSTEYNFLLVRYSADGLVDNTFGYNGIVVFEMRYSTRDTVSSDVLHCLALQPDGKILSAGASLLDLPYSPGMIAIARNNPDGSTDQTFNSGLGKLRQSYQERTGHERWSINSIALQPDGYIIAGITAISSYGMNQLAVARYKPNASDSPTSSALDPTFGNNGITFETRPGIVNDQRMTAIALTPSGKIVALGHNFGTWFLMRYGANGTIDNTFGTAGQTVSDLSPSGDIPAGMILLPRDMILVGMSFDTFYGLSVMGTFGLARYTSAGQLDQNFGKVRLPFMVKNVKQEGQLTALAMQDTNKVILAGYTETGQQVWDFTMTRIILKPLTTGIETPLAEVAPTSFHLSQSYPNPFNPQTRIEFSIPNRGFVSLKVYDALGQEVATLVSENRAAGRYSVNWNASGFSSGVYFYRLQSGNFVETKKLVLLK